MELSYERKRFLETCEKIRTGRDPIDAGQNPDFPDRAAQTALRI